MQTSRQVCDRILWDARLNSEAFSVGFAVRQRAGDNKVGNDIREKPFLEWVSQTDIPWHRIRYIRCAGTLVWERERHIDLFSTNQLPSAAFTAESVVSVPPATPPATFKQTPVYQYISQSWQALGEIDLQSVVVSDLSVVTYNVLCDSHESERIQTSQRIPAIISQLQNCNADIIALQEATPALLEALLSQTWIQDYFISEPADTTQLTPYGLLLISRLPFTLKEYRFSSHKRVLVASFLINNQFLQVAVVHLPSNRAYQAEELRKNQLKIILNYLNYMPGDCLIVGDFNSADLGEKILKQNGFIDVWQALQPQETGYTFDPQRNALAAVMSQTGNSLRIDQMWLRSNRNNLQPQSIELFATDAIPGTQNSLYPSDHFGLKAVYVKKQLPVQTVKPVYQSAIVIIPPKEIWPTIQKIRQRYDSKVGRWMPHITLIYGFVAESYFAEAVQLIEEHLKTLQPFEITLSEFDSFSHRSNCTAWLRPAPHPPEALHQLQATLQNLFPECNEQSNKSRSGFTPHLSVGQFKSPAEAQELLPFWHPLTFTVESVALISRRGDQPFQVQHIVKLGNQQVSNLLQIIRKIEPALTAEQREKRALTFAIIQQACQECFREAQLQLFGSARLGVETPESDLDVVCVIPAPISELVFLKQVAEKLQGLTEKCRLVEGTLPTLRLQLEGVDVDLLCACTHSMAGQLLEPAALKGCREADELLLQVEKRVALPQFRDFLRIVRGWAKIRSIHGNSWGFLGNFSWALLAAICCVNFPKDEEITLENLLSHFFLILSKHDWQIPLSLSEAGRSSPVKVPPDWLPIISSLKPCQNTARNITKSTAEIIRREFARGKAILAEDKSGESLFKPASLKTQSPQFLILTATFENPDNLEEYAGVIEGQFIGLVIDLEKQLKTSIRPWPGVFKNLDNIEFVLGIDIFVNPNPQALDNIVNNFILRFNNENEVSQNCRWKFELKNPEQM